MTPREVAGLLVRTLDDGLRALLAGAVAQDFAPKGSLLTLAAFDLRDGRVLGTTHAGMRSRPTERERDGHEPFTQQEIITVPS